MRSIEVLMRPLYKSIVGKPDLEPLLWEIESSTPACGALCLKVLVVGTTGKVRVVSKGILPPRYSRSAQHPSGASTGAHGANAGDEGALLEVIDPDRREAVVIRVEWNQEATTDDGDVWRNHVVTLKISQANQVGVIVSGLTATIGRERLQKDGS